MAHDEAITRVIKDRRAQKPSHNPMAVLRQVIGGGMFIVGCGVLFLVLIEWRHPLKVLGIAFETAPAIALLLLGLGVLIPMLGDTSLREVLESASRAISPDDGAGQILRKAAAREKGGAGAPPS